MNTALSFSTESLRNSESSTFALERSSTYYSQNSLSSKLREKYPKAKVLSQL